MKFLKNILNSLSTDDDKEGIKPKPKPPRKFKLTYHGNIRPKTKYIIENQMSKSLDDFNKRVDEYTKWIDNNLLYYMVHPHYRMWPSLAHLPIDVDEIDRKNLLALKAALSKHYNSSSAISQRLIGEIKNALKRNGHKYVMRTGKH